MRDYYSTPITPKLAMRFATQAGYQRPNLAVPREFRAISLFDSYRAIAKLRCHPDNMSHRNRAIDALQGAASQASRLCNALTRLTTRVQQLPVTPVPVRQLFYDIMAINQQWPVRYNHHGLTVDAGNITLEHADEEIDFGPWALSVSPRLSLKAAPHQPLAFCSVADGTYYHPHVDGQDICFGSMRETVSNMSKRWMLFELVQTAIDALHTYNPSDSYRPLCDFTQTLCARCGEAMDDGDVECFIGDLPYCGDCSDEDFLHCAVCDQPAEHQSYDGVVFCHHHYCTLTEDHYVLAKPQRIQSQPVCVG